MTGSAPLGVFDSGVGGLSVVKALHTLLPAESIYYVADTHHCPYGPRPASEILKWSRGIAQFLTERDCKAIVVACNTASAAALAGLREQMPDTPFVGMVPAVKPAARLTRSGVVGVLATDGTFRGHLYEEAVNNHAHGVRVISRVCRGLVAQVERGDLDGPNTVTLLSRCVMPMIEAGADTLVLGCTHYPFLRPALSRLVGPDVTILEPSDAVARQTARVLTERGLLAEEAPPLDTYATSGDPHALASVLPHLLPDTVPTVCPVRWEGDRLVL